MEVKFSVATNYAGSEVTETVDLPADFTDEQIEKEWQDWCWEKIDGYWKKI